MSAPPPSRRGRRRGRSSSGGGGGGKKQQKTIPAEFWGDVEKLPPRTQGVRIADHPAAVVQSLGRPPLPGHEVPAEHTFKLAYQYAVDLGGVLAAAGELIEPEELQEES